MENAHGLAIFTCNGVFGRVEVNRKTRIVVLTGMISESTTSTGSASRGSCAVRSSWLSGAFTVVVAMDRSRA